MVKECAYCAEPETNVKCQNCESTFCEDCWDFQIARLTSSTCNECDPRAIHKLRILGIIGPILRQFYPAASTDALTVLINSLYSIIHPDGASISHILVKLDIFNKVDGSSDDESDSDTSESEDEKEEKQEKIVI